MDARPTLRPKALFLSDIDGTLVKGDRGITPGVLRAARGFIRAGGMLSLCTGRSAAAALPVARQLQLNSPCIFCGGAAIYDILENRYLHTSLMPPTAIQALAQVLQHAPDVSVQALTAGGIYILRRNDLLNRKGVKEENQGPVSPLAQIKEQIIKVVLCCEDRQQLAGCQTFFPANDYYFAFASRHFVDIVPANSRKSDAMQRLSEHLGIPLDRIFSAGDGMTDLPMLQLSAKSYVPRNALEEVRKHADLIIGTVEEGGMEQAFDHATALISRLDRV